MTDTNENIEPVQEVELTAGEMLRNARTTGRRKREIPTIAKQLCIREEFLQALEDGDYSVIPETVYILGFARNYAMELGLNPDEIVEKIKQEMGHVADGLPARNNDTDSDGGAHGIAGRVRKAAKDNKGLVAQAYSLARRHWLWLVAGVAALIAVVVFVMMLGASPVDNGTEVSGVAPAAVAETVTQDPKFGINVRERFGTENRAGAVIVLQALQESWVKVEDLRGNTVFSRVLVPGDVYYVPGTANHKATFGNAGGIDIWAGGVLMEKAGPAHTRKTGISLAPTDLKPAAAE